MDSNKVPLRVDSKGHNSIDDGNAPSTKKEGRCSNLKNCLCSPITRKIVFGFFITASVAVTSTGTTHILKELFDKRQIFLQNSTQLETLSKKKKLIYDAPLFTTLFCTAWIGLFFPFYLLSRSTCFRKEEAPVKTAFRNIVDRFRERNITFGKFVTRCILFCVLWASSNYTYFYSLRILNCTDILALQATHIGFVYLLAWVILHEQFVGVRIVAVILCNTGIALLAYMDGITESKTLLGVVLTAASAAALAIFKVLLRKIFGNTSKGQLSLCLSFISFLNTLLLAPIVVVLMLTETETIVWGEFPWLFLLIAGALSFAMNLMVNYGNAITYEIFVTLGIISAVPLSAIIDEQRNHVIFEGMKLGGVVLICCGFLLVMFPANWPQFLSKLYRWGRYRKRRHHHQHQEPVDYRTGLISRSHLRSPSGLIR